ncbi:hypothetical protein [Melissospora conviva]|uniref:hypothetical protein n=1 Tax=Melissospora conviva TaxID=3388432 RepID=UPI003C135DC2
MIKSIPRWPAGALLLTLALSGCTGQATPAPAEATSYRVVEDLCERLDHAWITEFIGTPVKVRAFEAPPGDDVRRWCTAGAATADMDAISVQVNTRTNGELSPQPEPAKPLGGVGDQAYIRLSEPFTFMSEHLGREQTSRIDSLMAAQGPATVMVTITVHGPTVPDDAAIQAVLTAYGKDVFALMAESPDS